MLHHAPGINKVAGGEPFEARVDYKLIPAGGDASLLDSSSTGKTASTFNWKAAVLLASNVVPMAMAARMFSGALNPAMMKALANGRASGAGLANADPLMNCISMFLNAGGAAGPTANSGHSGADTAIAAAMEQEGKAVIAQVKPTSR